ncbi:tetratricopeptide repeat protein, partial [Roseofilum capinflatum]
MNLLWKGLLIVVILVASIILPAQAISMREFPHQVWDQESATPRLISAVDESRNLEDVAQEAFTAANQGDFATAEADWTQILEAYPESAAAWSNRGITRASQGDFEGAIADYNEAIELMPTVADPYLNRGAALEGLGRYTEAIEDYNHILEINPDDAQAYNNRGNAKMGLQDWEGAIADYKTCNELAPNFAF